MEDNSSLCSVPRKFVPLASHLLSLESTISVILTLPRRALVAFKMPSLKASLYVSSNCIELIPLIPVCDATVRWVCTSVVGNDVGGWVGKPEGSLLGCPVGAVGTLEGWPDGCPEGILEGCPLGTDVGTVVGSREGKDDGADVGPPDG